MKKVLLWTPAVGAFFLLTSIEAFSQAAPAPAKQPAPGQADAGKDEILVTATRTERSVHDIPASVQVIDGETIKRANATGLGELFRAAVGLDLQGGGFPGEQAILNVRGMTAGYQSPHVLVLVDGRRINDQYQSSVEMGQLPADNIERIEIIRGPASALYGSNAEGGVINIITKKGTGKPETRISAEGGDFNTQRYKMSHGGQKGDFDYFVTGSYFDTDGYMRNSDGTKRDWSAMNFTGNFGWQVGRDSELRLGAGNYSGEGTDEQSERKARRDYEDLVYSLKWDKNRDAKLRVRAYRNGEHSEYAWKHSGTGIYDMYTVGGEAQQSLWVAERNLVTVGAEGRQDNVDIDEVLGPTKQDATTTGVYGQDEIRLNDQWQLTMGLRDDYNEDYGSELSPRLGILYKPSKNNEIFASANRAHRAPSLSDKYVRVEYNGLLFQGNPDLNPETVTAYEVGTRCRFGENATAELSVFFNDMKDTFDFLMDPDGQFRNHNVTRSRAAGFETGVRWMCIRNLTLFANWTFTDGKYDEYLPDPTVEGNEIAFLARDRLGFGLDFATSKGLASQVECSYAGPRYIDAQNTADTRLDGYVVVNWRSSVELFKRVRLMLNINNLFDEKYQSLPRVDEPGRNFMAGMEVAF